MRVLSSPMDPDQIQRYAVSDGSEAVHAQLRRTAELLDARPDAGVERAAPEMLGRLDTQLELDRLLRGLEAGASLPSADGEAGTGR